VDTELRERWERLTGLLGIDEAEATRVLRDLWRRHDEPQRVYHGLSHVRHVLEVIDLLRAEADVADPIAVQLAAWFHDAVHMPGAQDNEARSVDLAVEALTGWALADDRVAHVAALIRATAGHEGRGADADTAVLLDADLAILAADPATYEIYRRAIRVEHVDLDDEAWRRGRGAFLAGMLARPTIYATASMRRRGEQAARDNLTGELVGLEHELPS
jgi:predicted metal-dependent HD superfamily phosphohydrolase